jgi:hypothetical protein
LPVPAGCGGGGGGGGLMAAFDGAETGGPAPAPDPLAPPGCGWIGAGLIDAPEGAVGDGDPPGAPRAPGPPGCGNAVLVEGVAGARVVEGVFCPGGAPGLVGAP